MYSHMNIHTQVSTQLIEQLHRQLDEANAAKERVHAAYKAYTACLAAERDVACMVVKAQTDLAAAERSAPATTVGADAGRNC